MFNVMGHLWRNFFNLFWNKKKIEGFFFITCLMLKKKNYSVSNETKCCLTCYKKPQSFISEYDQALTLETPLKKKQKNIPALYIPELLYFG